MSDVITIVGSSMSRDIERLNTASQNIANVRTDGYKKLIDIDSPIKTAAQKGGSVEGQDKSVDFSSGTLKRTDNPFDVAVSGNGFLVVKGPAGEAYTRRGGLSVSAEGILQLQSGEAVLGDLGTIYLSPEKFEIKENGDVMQNGNLVSTLRIDHVDNPHTLAYLGSGLFRPSQASILNSTDNSQVKQGYLETSNVETLDEMVSMMSVVRHYEASGQVLRAYDDVLDASINKMGNY